MNNYINIKFKQDSEFKTIQNVNQFQTKNTNNGKVTTNLLYSI